MESTLILDLVFELDSQPIINSSPPSAGYMHQWIGLSATNFSEIWMGIRNPNHFHSRKLIWKCRLPQWRPFCPGGDELTKSMLFNSLVPERCSCLKLVIFKLIWRINILNISCKIAPRWMPQDQVMAWCHQATSHYLNQCWPSIMTSYGMTRSQWVKHNQGF